jgi:hypothetical protein
MEVCLKLDNIKLENRPYTEVSFDETPTINTILGAFILLVSLVLMALVERWKSKAYGPL